MLLKIFEYFLLLILPILINVAFLTLLERKLLSFMHIRVGPNKVGAYGLLQPFSDAVKLFSKNIPNIKSALPSVYTMAPVVGFILGLIFSSCVTSYVGPVSVKYLFLFMLMLFSLGIYPVMLGGWASPSKYSFLGAMRGVAQTISYEISMGFTLMSIFVVMSLLSVSWSSGLSTLSVSAVLMVVVIWLIVMVAELSRTPFDFTEGESELVSGFNTEYMSAMFALIFLGEYTMIHMAGVVSSYMIFGYLTGVKGMLMSVIFMSFIILLRASLPRSRYDLLMSLSWKALLPLSMGSLALMSALTLMLS